MEGLDILGAEDVERRKKNARIGAAVGAGVALLSLFGWSRWKQGWGSTSWRRWSLRKLTWSGKWGNIYDTPAEGVLTAVATTVVGAAAGAGAGYGVARIQEHRENAALAAKPAKPALPGAPSVPGVLPKKAA